jgi:hypothetical protein
MCDGHKQKNSAHRPYFTQAAMLDSVAYKLLSGPLSEFFDNVNSENFKIDFFKGWSACRVHLPCPPAVPP